MEGRVVRYELAVDEPASRRLAIAFEELALAI
jgi:signal recognition particle subunit SEC65